MAAQPIEPGVAHERGLTTTAEAQKPYHHGHLRDALIAAGMQLIADDGLEKLTIRALAERVGVSHAAPQYHFPGKAALIVAIATRGFEQLGSALQAPWTSSAATPAERLTAMGQAYVDFAFANTARYRLMFATGIPGQKADSDQFCDAAARTFDLLNNAIAAVVGAPAPSDPVASDAERAKIQGAAFFAWSAVHGAIMLQLDGTFSSLHDEGEGHASLPPMQQLMPALLGHVAIGLGVAAATNDAAAGNT